MPVKERAAHKAISEATEQLERLQTHSISTDDEPKKRGPGRPPKAPVSLEQAEHALEAACREHARLAEQPEVRPTDTVSALHATGILLAQLVFFHPLGRGFGEGVTKAHTLRHFEAG